MIQIAVLGLGYVGLPLAVEFSKKYNTFGFDINTKRIEALQNGIDWTNEINSNEIVSSRIIFTSNIEEIKKCNFFIITVPTPVNNANQPDFKPLIDASDLISNILKKDDIVVYESTVYPGATEEICVPILEKKSKLKLDLDFSIGYSPERINPGDKERTLTKIKKIVSASNPEALNKITQVYGSIISAGIIPTTSIKVAEAAKVIENVQRDVNIALINELAILFEKLNISTQEVLEAASTKWNFQPFSPGLVGGHCIGVDPYYLTHKAQMVGYHPELILAGRKINDGMSQYVVDKSLKEMTKKNITIKKAKVLLLGQTFKENCPDTRNSGSLKLLKILKEFEMNVFTCDPWITNPNMIDQENDHHLKIHELNGHTFDLIIVSVAHLEFKKLGPILRSINPNGIIIDLKNIIKKDFVDFYL
jgi:UDP-N-acetyl-D-galactosamine dehydrogenase